MWSCFNSESLLHVIYNRAVLSSLLFCFVQWQPCPQYFFLPLKVTLKKHKKHNLDLVRVTKKTWNNYSLDALEWLCITPASLIKHKVLTICYFCITSWSCDWAQQPAGWVMEQQSVWRGINQGVIIYCRWQRPAGLCRTIHQPGN